MPQRHVTSSVGMAMEMKQLVLAAIFFLIQVGQYVTPTVALPGLDADVLNWGDFLESPPSSSPSATADHGPAGNAMAEKESGRRKLVTGEGFWHTNGNQILDQNNQQVHFSGVNWGGFETANCIVDGLYAVNGAGRSYTSHLTQMASLGFNLIRLAFAGSCFTTIGQKPPITAIDFAANPDLKGQTVIQCMQLIVAAAGKLGIRIILDYHRKNASHTAFGPENGLWYDSTHTVDVWLTNWAYIAKAFAGNPTVVGVDLFNEPHNVQVGPTNASYFAGGGPTWSDTPSDPTSWRNAAYNASLVIQSYESNWLICVQGLWQGTWWGANLTHVGIDPLILPTPNQVVYQVHDYGPHVSQNQSWLLDTSFPANLEGYWNDTWGFVHINNIAPVWVGEFGSIYNLTSKNETDLKDNVWFHTFIDYIDALGLSWTFFTWTPASTDTGGILEEDYQTANLDKISALSPIFHPSFGLANISDTPGFANNGPHQVGTLAPIGINYIWAQPAPAIPAPTNYFSSRADRVRLDGGYRLLSVGGNRLLAFGRSICICSVIVIYFCEGFKFLAVV